MVFVGKFAQRRKMPTLYPAFALWRTGHDFRRRECS
jgi:hypothetical protein